VPPRFPPETRRFNQQDRQRQHSAAGPWRRAPRRGAGWAAGARDGWRVRRRFQLAQAEAHAPSSSFFEPAGPRGLRSSLPQTFDPGHPPAAPPQRRESAGDWRALVRSTGAMGLASVQGFRLRPAHRLTRSGGPFRVLPGSTRPSYGAQTPRHSIRNCWPGRIGHMALRWPGHLSDALEPRAGWWPPLRSVLDAAHPVMRAGNGVQSGIGVVVRLPGQSSLAAPRIGGNLPSSRARRSAADRAEAGPPFAPAWFAPGARLT